MARASAPHIATTFREAAPDWAAMSERLLQLNVREAEILEELDVQQRALNEVVGASGGTFPLPEVMRKAPSQQPLPVKPMGQRVKELLSGVPMPEPQPELPRNPDVETPYSKRMRELCAELEDVRAAIALLHPAVAAATKEGSQRYCTLRLDEYNAMCERICRALIEFGEAAIAHDAFVFDLVEQGAQPAFLKPVYLDDIGRPRDPTSALRRFLGWAAEAGHLDGRLIPAGWYDPEPKHPSRDVIRERMCPAPEPFFKAPKRKLPRNPFIRVANATATVPDRLAALIHPG